MAYGWIASALAHNVGDPSIGFRVECLADADCSHSGVQGSLGRDVLDASTIDAAAQ